MIPELGHFALILALTFAVIQSLIPLLGVWRNKESWMALGKQAAIGQCFFISIAFFTLIAAFITNDFSVIYVAENSNTTLPLFYKFTALWGAHEGSMLLWVSILSVWTSCVVIFSRSLPLAMTARVLAVLGFISIGFLVFILTTSDPFLRSLPNFPSNGISLNPLLQDPGLATHPPILYMGYVGFSVVFAFAIAALLSGRLDPAWARWSRPWTLAAWCFLTCGITLGSSWSYRVLGWGGWWFWDPVENASILPWLTGTALLHAFMVVEKRNAFKGWTVLIAICTFSLSILGTFLVRSGVLISVHAFAVDPARGATLLIVLFLTLGIALLLYAWRATHVKEVITFGLLSRETLILTQSVILMVAMATILLGTLYPLLLQVLNLGRISVGPPYFNAVFIPLIVPVLFLTGVGPQVRWQQMPIKELYEKFRFLFLVTGVLAVTLEYCFTQQENFYVLLGLGLGLWIILTTLQKSLQVHRHFFLGTLGKSYIPAHHYAMSLAHIGLAITLIGITLTSHYSVERDVRLAPSESTSVAGYLFTFVSIEPLQGENYTGFKTEFRITKDHRRFTTLYPEARYFTVQQQRISKPGIKGGIFRDFYVALGEKLSFNAWAIRIYYKPFIRWIWAGGFMMMLGGILAAFDRRYRTL